MELPLVAEMHFTMLNNETQGLALMLV